MPQIKKAVLSYINNNDAINNIITKPMYNSTVVLGVSTAANCPVPATAKFVRITHFVSPVYFIYDATATIPGATVTDGTTSVMNIANNMYECDGVSNISFICATAGPVQCTFYC